MHRAITHEGDQVVIKVQRPGVGENIRADLSVLHYIARALEAVIEEVGVYSPTGIVEEFDRAIHEELDFLNEASNTRAFHRNHKDRPYVRIPRVYEELSTRTVLTLEFIDGARFGQAVLDDEGKKTLAKNILEGSFNQLFVDGLFSRRPAPRQPDGAAGPRAGAARFRPRRPHHPPDAARR